MLPPVIGGPHHRMAAFNSTCTQIKRGFDARDISSSYRLGFFEHFLVCLQVPLFPLATTMRKRGLVKALLLNSVCLFFQVFTLASSNSCRATTYLFLDCSLCNKGFIVWL